MVLPDEAWARRISGTFANQLALDEPACAHAVLKPVLDHMRGASYLVSVRAPIARSDDAAALCQQFGGTGRVGAAGIDRLPSARLDAFVAAFQAVPWTAHQHH
ncbi:MAG TPA: hypothetical protein VFS42_07175 [Burkholderiaceae bacterium]|nr:hypothetical protein [Burkholderiaceae bacterium]